ncbi:MAG TPA: hypothetical protein ENG30_03905 [Thermofilaceae archaeon]|nr:hypothetical protein [Thermofilaceae archaeon]
MGSERLRVERVKKLRQLIEALDGYRVGRYTDLSRVERLVEELNLKLPHGWSAIRGDIEGILELPRRSPLYPRLSKAESIASILSKVNLALLALAVFSYMLAHTLLFMLLVISSLVMVNVVYFLRTYVNLKISAIYASNLDELEALGIRIRDSVDYLIRQLKRELRAMSFKLEDFRLKLWVPDYGGIRVVKKPSIFSSRYEVSLA